MPFARALCVAAALALTAAPAAAESAFELLSPGPAPAAAAPAAPMLGGPLTPAQVQQLLQHMPAMGAPAVSARPNLRDWTAQEEDAAEKADMRPRGNSFSSLPYDSPEPEEDAPRAVPAAGAADLGGPPLGLERLMQRGGSTAPAAPSSPTSAPISAALGAVAAPEAPPREQRSPGFVLIPATGATPATAAPAPPPPVASGPPQPIVLHRADGVAVPPPIAAGDASWDSCTLLLKELPEGVVAQAPMVQGCEPVALRNDCGGDRYLVLCKSAADGRGCETTDAIVPAGGTVPFQICVRGNYVMQHAACSAPAGCDSFVSRPLLPVGQ